MERTVYYGERIYVAVPQFVVSPEVAEAIGTHIDKTLRQVLFQGSPLEMQPVGVTLQFDPDYSQGHSETSYSRATGKVFITADSFMIPQMQNESPSVPPHVLVSAVAAVGSIGIMNAREAKGVSIQPGDQVKVNVALRDWLTEPKVDNRYGPSNQRFFAT